MEFYAQYQLKIKSELSHENRMTMNEIHLLLSAYANWRFTREDVQKLQKNKEKEDFVKKIDDS
jgi:hypothetical protein